MHRSQSQGGELLYVVVAALLIAPLLSVMALLVLAGPSTRAALAGEDHARLDASAGQPLAGEAAGDLTPIFEPRVGRFRLGEAEPSDGGRAREALDQGRPGEALLAGRDGGDR